jgi:hypothetical protein
LNNALSSYVLQAFGKIASTRPLTTACLCKVGWRDPEFARQLHALGLDLARRGETARLHCGPVEVAANRFSINCISWFGEDMARAGGVRGSDEEEELSASMALRLRRRNCLFTDAVAAHFAFYSQREVLDRTDVLRGYESLLRAREDVAPWMDRVDAAHAAAEAQDDGASWGWPPPRPPKRWYELRRWFPRRRRPSGVRLSVGPAL